ncbi:AAA family ATPase [Candidatus Microgenomates bacterium]|nr:AAA family ATPase [Candidatus Microgenomates bacterium]
MINKIISEIVKVGESRDKSQISKLIFYLNHNNGNVRRLACSALGKIGSPITERSLMGVLFDEKPQVRQYAIKALFKLGTKICLPALEMIIRNPEEKEYNIKSAKSVVWKIKKRGKKETKINIAGEVNFDLNQSFSSGLDLSQDQKQVLTDLTDWLKKPKGQSITVGGYAGTGKTTLIGVLRKMIKNISPKARIAFACYTGKASQVLKSKLLEQKSLYSKDFCGTIHSLMYSPRLDKHGKIIGWRRNRSIPYNLIIIDEASMVTENIWHDLKSYGILIICVGDHGQLPPIDDGFNLMEKPILRLERIHRQAKGNPIIQVANLARTSGNIPTKQYSLAVKKLKKQTSEAQSLCQKIFADYNNQTLILCGRNRTRVYLNQKIRNILGHHSNEPINQETLICLKNNYENPDGPIFNGMLGKLLEIKPHKEHWYKTEIYFPDEKRYFKGLISKYQFNQERFIEEVKGIHYKEIGDRFDFGYALTVHKAQGSQANRVLLFEEPCSHWPGELWNRWLYTAVTRAIKELYIIGE